MHVTNSNCKTERSLLETELPYTHTRRTGTEASPQRAVLYPGAHLLLSPSETRLNVSRMKGIESASLVPPDSTSALPSIFHLNTWENDDVEARHVIIIWCHMKTMTTKMNNIGVRTISKRITVMADSEQIPSRLSSANETFRPLSSGPMQLSDLNSSSRQAYNTYTSLKAYYPFPLYSVMPPRRLKPISPPQQRKKKKRRRLPPPSTSHQPPEPSPSDPPAPPTLMNQDMLSQLRARLEQPEDEHQQPISSVPSSPAPPSSLTLNDSVSPSPRIMVTPSPPETAHTRTPGVGEEEDEEGVGGMSVGGRRQQRKKRRRRTPKAEPVGDVVTLSPELQEVAGVGVEQSEDSSLLSEQPLPQGEVIVNPQVTASSG